ncbi:MAG: DUF350 domain-containing protein [Myxococcales bacterium]|nr:DUF350 domain-containing protein [Myxococcales bacterium]
MSIDWEALVNLVIQCVVFSLIGVAMFFIAFFLIEKLTPFSIHKEIEEDHNTALGIVIGAMVLGIAIIVAAAIGG